MSQTTTQQPTAYYALVVYLDHAGTERSQSGLVMAHNPTDAVEGMLAAVYALPDCASIIGGSLEVMDLDGDGAPAEEAEAPIARGGNARQHTIH